jgi:NADPH-dependent glutamate synthase beta subunit-like oxidoreductase
VHATVLELDRLLAERRLHHPRSRRLAEEIHALVFDIAAGRAGRSHLPSIDQRIEELGAFSQDSAAVEIGQSLAARLDEHREIFASHVATQNCSAGVCDGLTPAPCQMACPAGIDVPSYVALIGQGRDGEAIDLIRRDNPFPWVCGLVCTRPCEWMCVRGRMDTPVSIKSLKAFAAERSLSTWRYQNPVAAPDTGRKVSVIGAGPSGLSAAYYLALKGYRVQVIEALPTAGGMLLVGIPRYRLPKEVIDREVEMIRSLGVTFSFNTRFGQDISLQQMKNEGTEAFFFAIGAHTSFKLGISGEQEFSQVHEAIDFLKRVALGETSPPGRRVAVVGGGNVAIDAARTCLRLGCAEVTLAYRRTQDEMPADHEEVEQALEEGVRFSLMTIPMAIEGEAGRVSALGCIRAKMVQSDDSGRKSPKPIPGSDFRIEADAIISAIGQRVDRQGMSELDRLTWSRRDTIMVHGATMETNIPGVFAGGDAVTGPATVVEAIGAGKRAAQAIDRYLRGVPQPVMPPVPVRRSRIAFSPIGADAKSALRRPEMPLLAIDRRKTTFQQVELGYSEEVARNEAQRCLRCDICRRCGRCVEICRNKMGVDALQLGFLNFDHPGPTDLSLTQQRCIGCGACAANCPTGAMRLEDRDGERVLSICGTVLSRQPLLVCEVCGSVIGTERYLSFIHHRVSPKTPAQNTDRPLCDSCARRKGYTVSADTVPVF